MELRQREQASPGQMGDSPNLRSRVKRISYQDSSSISNSNTHIKKPPQIRTTQNLCTRDYHRLIRSNRQLCCIFIRLAEQRSEPSVVTLISHHTEDFGIEDRDRFRPLS